MTGSRSFEDGYDDAATGDARLVDGGRRPWGIRSSTRCVRPVWTNSSASARRGRTCASSSRPRAPAGEALDHVLLYGPPGLGKTTLSNIVSRELGVGFRATSGPVIARAGDLAAILTNLQPRDVLFIDEIHRLNPAVEEILYPAMEDFQLDLVIGEGPAARSVRIDLPPFTPRRRDHPVGPDHHAAARALRHPVAPQLL